MKQRAVANIIQERQLLEEVCPFAIFHLSWRIKTDDKPLLTQVDHPFIVNLRYAFQDDANCFFALDLMLGGDLRCLSFLLALVYNY